jgi:putative intracellular protease/amidase
VLLFVPEEGYQYEMMLRAEVDVMKDLLMQSGFEVVVATVSGEVLTRRETSLVPDMKVSDVRADDFAGFVMADMGFPLHAADEFSSEVVAMVAEAAAKRKPVAAQHSSVVALAKAGVLSGRKYAFSHEIPVNPFSYFDGAVYSGMGVVRDGKIITSGSNPLLKKWWGFPDTTAELIDEFIEMMGGPR